MFIFTFPSNPRAYRMRVPRFACVSLKARMVADFSQVKREFINKASAEF